MRVVNTVNLAAPSDPLIQMQAGQTMTKRQMLEYLSGSDSNYNYAKSKGWVVEVADGDPMPAIYPGCWDIPAVKGKQDRHGIFGSRGAAIRNSQLFRGAGLEAVNLRKLL